MGVGDLTAIQPLLGAVLMLCVSVVQGVRTTLGMIFNCSLRDWRTVATREVLPQATSEMLIKEPTATTEAFSALCRESLLAHRGDSAWISSKQATGVLGTNPRMTPVMWRHSEWKRTLLVRDPR